jgi:hypothetical protein
MEAIDKDDVGSVMSGMMTVQCCGRGGGLNRSDKTGTGITKSRKGKGERGGEGCGDSHWEELTFDARVYSMTVLRCGCD